MKKSMIIFLVVMMSSVLLYAAGSVNSGNRTLYKTAVTSDKWVNANRMNGVFRNNGTWLFDNVRGDWGLEWPKGSGLSPMFAAGQWIGAKFPDSTIRVAGIQHSASEYQPGHVLPPYGDEVASNPRDGLFKWYELLPAGAGDWTNWPYGQGAPVDAEGNPDFKGNQTIFSVYNDLADHAEYGSKKLSIEVLHSAFAFNRADALGDMIFTKWRLVNKSGVNWDSTYFCIWTDPDVGGAADDFVGCDPELGLGYSYNADNDDQNYGAAPPAIGIDFFQGPIIDMPDSTVTLPDGTVLQDKMMLNMTSFMFYNNDNTPRGNPHEAKHIWNYFRGIWQDDSPILDPEGNPGTFMFTGDPETGEGWLDSDEADRRFIMTTGPFSMKAWEDENANGLPDFGEPGVQDIVAAVIVARGTDNLNSVTKLKEVDKLAQLAYDLNFDLADAPVLSRDDVKVSERPNEVVLSWSDAAEFNDDGSPYASQDPIVEKAMGDTVITDNVVKVIDDDTYNFYGYTIYQYSDASGRDPVKIDHWDIGGQKDASPYTFQRFRILSTNQHSDVGLVGEPLINGKAYYFGIVPEGYLEFGAPAVFPGPPVILTVIPRHTPGIRYHTEYNDTLEVVHAQVDTTLPLSQGSAIVWVVDPSKVTGDDYEVTFYTDTLDHPLWKLRNITDNTDILIDQTNQTGDDAYDVVDGLMVKVLGAEPSILSVVQTDANDWNTEIDDNLNFSLNASTSRAAGDVAFYMQAQGHEGTLASNYARWDWRHNTTPNDIVIEFVDNPETEGQLILSAWAGAASSANGDWLMNGWMSRDSVGAPDSVLHTTNGRLPFKVWMITPSGEKTQIIAGVLDDNDNWYWDMTREGYYTGANTGFERIYICNYPYDEAEILADGGDHVLNNVFWGSHWDWGHSVGRVEFCMYIDGYDSDPTGALFASPPSPGTVVRFNSAKPNSANDFYTFSAPTEAEATTLTNKADLDKINVVPNPYYGYHSGEMDPYNRWVQFTYLPKGSKIKIFDLAGNLVRTLEKMDGDSPFLQWDLKNRFDLPVASGVYVYHVEVPGVGEKIGKLAVFTPNERLDTY
jgi:hypothetical protein